MTRSLQLLFPLALAGALSGVLAGCALEDHVDVAGSREAGRKCSDLDATHLYSLEELASLWGEPERETGPETGYSYTMDNGDLAVVTPGEEGGPVSIECGVPADASRSHS